MCVCVDAGRVVVCERSTDETKILLACDNGTVVSVILLLLYNTLLKTNRWLSLHLQAIHDVTAGGKTHTTQAFIVS